ncbi:MAG: exodeoxyribonuclease VII large subunit [bacterium]|nr:exodeoxyribonuclease VII large subunit [bacterium]
MSLYSGSGSTDERQVLSVRQVNDAISDAIGMAFPRTIWVKGEVQRFPHDAAMRKHLYFELQETGGSGAAEYQIAMALMGWDRQRFNLGQYVDGTDPDFQITNKLEVCLECKVDFYAKFGKISLKVVGVDKTFALGKLEARRRETLRYLTERGLLESNAAIPMPELPLRIGLITSAESAAHHDFMTGIAASGWAFDVVLCSARMQGEMLQGEVLAALQAHQKGSVDVIVITRGGGSRADLSWFDQKDLAVGIAQSTIPVVTAIGHEIDTSIADIVAHQSCKTPTAAAEYLVEIIDVAARKLDDVTEDLMFRVNNRLEQAVRRLEMIERLPSLANAVLQNSRFRVQDLAGRLQHRVSGSLSVRREFLSRQSTRLQTGSQRIVMQNMSRLQSSAPRLERVVRQSLAQVEKNLQNQQSRLIREASKPAQNASLKLTQLEDKTRLLDPARLLKRGYSLTVNDQGKTITSADQLDPGEKIKTRFAQGQITSIVQPGTNSGKKKPNLAKGNNRGSKQKETGQKTLFR